jgi:hypothetical protein
MGEKWVSLVASQYIYMYALCALQKTFRMFENMDNKQKKKKEKRRNRETDMIR